MLALDFWSQVIFFILSFQCCSLNPFKFLGTPVGANPRWRETWKPVVKAMAKRLNSSTGRQLFYGRRITLINSVLASLLLIFFLFFRAPRCISDQLVRLQQNYYGPLAGTYLKELSIMENKVVYLVSWNIFTWDEV
jgi:hypothetical protein